jgi:hypothetical protein
MTPNEISTLIAEKFNKSLDLPFKLSIMERIKIYREYFIRQTLEKTPQERRFFMQTLFLPLVKSKEMEYLPHLCATAKVEIIRANNVIFDFVGSVDGQLAFSYISLHPIRYAKKVKYSKNKVVFSLLDNQIVVHEFPELPMVRVAGIFNDPYSIYAYTYETEPTCDFWDAPYPCKDEILQLCIEKVVTDLKGGGITPELSLSPNALTSIKQ